MLLAHTKIDKLLVNTIRRWKHSGFSIDNQVRIEASERDSIRHVAEYIGRRGLRM